MRGAVIRVLVAEDVRVVRETLIALLSLEEDIDVVASLTSGDRIMPAALRHRPDVALLDIDLPGVDGLTAAAELIRCLPGCRALIVTGLGSPDNLRRALAAGVSGFLLKDGPAAELIDAVRTVARGGRVIDQRLAWPGDPADRRLRRTGRSGRRREPGTHRSRMAVSLMPLVQAAGSRR